jgi:hypothetical protein
MTPESLEQTIQRIDDPVNLRAGIARARAMVGAVPSYVYDTVDTFWN